MYSADYIASDYPLDKRLVSYVNSTILPLYANFDAAHQIDHVQSVISQSLYLSQYYAVNINMVFAIAAYHDVGLSKDRATHHLVSARQLKADLFMNSFFSEYEIEIMAEAIEDHRASNKQPPRTIYGKIVAEADRLIDGNTIVRRTILYGLSHYPQLNKEQHYERFLEHMHEKYAKGGYLKLWLPESPNVKHLAAFQELLFDRAKTRRLFDYVWNEIKIG